MKRQGNKGMGADQIGKLLSFLAKNGLGDIGAFAKSMKIKEEVAQEMLKEANLEYGISPTISINPVNLGYVSFLVSGKFYGGSPGISELRQELKKDPHIQLALLQDDDSTMLLYYLIEKERHDDYYGWNFTKAFYEIQRNLFSHYYISWFISRITPVQGNIPVSNAFFDLLLNITWRRTKAEPRPLPGQFTYKKFLVLKELFYDSMQDPSEIDKKNGFTYNFALNTIKSLKESRIITNYSINIENALKLGACILHTPMPSSDFLSSINKQKGFAPKLLFVGDTFAPMGTFALLRAEKDEVKRFMEKADIKYASISGIKELVLGHLPSDTI